MIQERHKQFLLGQARANEIRHSGRTLYTHLCNTHSLLRSWDSRDDVCHAGLFHSIYGTRVFLQRPWSIKDRDTIRDLIGPSAEELVYLFCVLDRPKVLIKLAGVDEPAARDYRTLDMVKLPEDTYCSLLEIEAANLLDQGGRRWLKSLRDCQISKPARAAISRHLEIKDAASSGDSGERRPAGH